MPQYGKKVTEKILKLDITLKEVSRYHIEEDVADVYSLKIACGTDRSLFTIFFQVHS